MRQGADGAVGGPEPLAPPARDAVSARFGREVAGSPSSSAKHRLDSFKGSAGAPRPTAPRPAGRNRRSARFRTRGTGFSIPRRRRRPERATARRHRRRFRRRAGRGRTGRRTRRGAGPRPIGGARSAKRVGDCGGRGLSARRRTARRRTPRGHHIVLSHARLDLRRRNRSLSFRSRPSPRDLGGSGGGRADCRSPSRSGVMVGCDPAGGRPSRSA